jgi:aspartate-semialdehyde dehydrogenase
MVGQRMIQLLAGHPWFEIAALTGSERTVGRPYGDLVNWKLDNAPPPEVARMVVQPSDDVLDVAIALSALPTDVARDMEPRWAERVAVCSNASTYRAAGDVPLIIPEVNPDHLALLTRQREQRGWRGGLVTNPNCATAVLATVLAPLDRAFGVRRAVVATLQAASGAGYPGVPALDLVVNVLPWIAGEDPKIETECARLLGRLDDGAVTPAPLAVSAMVHRVPVLDGHLVSASLSFAQPVSPDQARAVLADFRGDADVRALPSTPAVPIEIDDRDDRPQPRLDRDRGRGMAVTVGRIRPCPVQHLRLVALGHNLVRGAAGAALQNAELLLARGLVETR